MRIVLLGPPGSGKGTESELLIKDLGIPQISTGDIFRDNIKNKTPLGEKVKAYIDEGKLVPDDVTTEIVVDRLTKDDVKDGYILDGFPRTINQAKSFDEFLEKNNEKLDFVLYFKVSKEVLIERISGRRICPKCASIYHTKNIKPKEEGVCDSCGEALVQRKDDNVETASKRIDIYNEATAPLIGYYQDKNLIEIEADSGIKNLHEEVLKSIGVS